MNQSLLTNENPEYFYEAFFAVTYRDLKPEANLVNVVKHQLDTNGTIKSSQIKRRLQPNENRGKLAS